MNFINEYLEKTNFSSSSDFHKNFSFKLPDEFNYAFDVIDKIAAHSPHRRAMIWCDDNGAEKTFTFKQIADLGNKAANAFKSLGLAAGDPVLLILKSRYEYWYCALGLMKLGCMQIPATHQLTAKDIVYRCEAAGIKAILSVNDDNVLSSIREASGECSTLEHLLTLDGGEGFINFTQLLDASSDEYNEVKRFKRNENIMLMYFTSGTTGMPKMVAHDFYYPLGHLITGAYWHNLNQDSVHFTVADTGWAKAGWGKFYGQWMMGATLFIYDYERFSAPRMLEKLAKYKVTAFCAPPTIFRFMIQEDMSKYDLSSLVWGNVAGEPLNPEVYQRFYNLTGVKLHEGFGQSETTPLLMNDKWMEPRPGSTGKPSPLYDVDLVDSNLNSVEAGEEGEIVVRLPGGVRPPGLFMGYYRDEERTAEAFAGGVYHTGDMAWRDERGYYWFVGRLDDVIKSSGYRIGPFEVESALLTHPAVLECAITAAPDAIRGQIVKATVVLVSGYLPSDALKTELQDHVKKVTAPYKYPRIVEFIDELPKTISGKIQRKKLRDDK